MTTLEWLEALSYIVTVIGLPFAIIVFLREQRKERQNDDEEVYLQLSDDYAKFLRLVLDHADLRLMTQTTPREAVYTRADRASQRALRAPHRDL